MSELTRWQITCFNIKKILSQKSLFSVLSELIKPTLALGFDWIWRLSNDLHEGGFFRTALLSLVISLNHPILLYISDWFLCKIYSIFKFLVQLHNSNITVTPSWLVLIAYSSIMTHFCCRISICFRLYFNTICLSLCKWMLISSLSYKHPRRFVNQGKFWDNGPITSFAEDMSDDVSGCSLHMNTAFSVLQGSIKDSFGIKLKSIQC